MTWPTYRNRYLPALDLEAIGSIPDKAHSPVILPIGAVEQHGPHLPVGVDALVAQARLDYALPRLPEDLPVWVAPPIQIGKSNEHTGFPGTLMVSKTVLRRQILAIARQLHEWGFRCLLILNTHGGNIQVIRYTIPEIERELGMSVHRLSFSSGLELDEQEAAYGFHAGEIETAIMLEILDGKAIEMEHATCEFPASIQDPGRLRPEAAPAIYSWVTSDLSQSGVMGDARAATRERGRAWLDGESGSLARQIARICASLKEGSG
jgi:creatinine amidohydrolase